MAIIGSFLLSKGKDFAISKATAYAKGKLIDETKKRVSNAVFGKAIGEAGELSEEQDFRGRLMYKEVKPSKIVALFCGGSVIDTRDLDEKLLDQAIQTYDLNAHTSIMSHVRRNEDGLQTISEDTIVLTGDEKSEKDLKTYGQLSDEEKAKIGQAGESRQPEPARLTADDAKIEENINKPISIDDFDSMVTREGNKAKEPAKNKGYVRFAKVKGADGKFGVKLEKVGNKCGWFMSWRTNVTKEHNRQLRMLFADTLLADFGGLDGIDATDNTQYGAYLTERLGEIRSAILNGNEPGKMLERKTIRNCIDNYRALFKDSDEMKRIAQSFLQSCLLECQFVKDGNPNPSVEEFLKAYGQNADAGLQTMDDLMKLLSSATNGKELRAAMEKVADAFGRMNEAWQVDKAAAHLLGDIQANPTTANGGLPTQEQDLARLKKALVRRLEKQPDYQGTNAYEDVNLFFKENAFSLFVRSARVTWGTNPDDPNRDTAFRKTLTLDNLVGQAKAFAAKIHDIEKRIAEKESSKGSPIDLVIEIKQREKDDVDEKLKASLEAGRPDEDLTSRSIDLGRQIQYLTDIRNQASGDTALMSAKLKERLKEIDFEFEEKKNELADSAKTDLEKERKGLTLDSLTAMIAESSKQVVTRDFARGFVLDGYLREQFPNLANEKDLRVGEEKLNGVFGELDRLRQDLDNRISAFEAAIDVALAANLKDKGDIAMAKFISKLADHLLTEISVDKLGNESSAALNSGDPRLAPTNKRQTSVQSFVEGFVEAAVKSAIDRKVKGEEKLSASLEMFKSDSQALVNLIAGLFDRLSANKNYGGLKAFFRSVNTYSMTNAKAVDKASVKILKNAYSTGLRDMLHLKLIRPFLEEDVMRLMEEEPNLERFAEMAGVKFQLRVDEMVAAFTQTMEHQVYEGRLGFTTVPDEEKVHAESLASVKDPRTGYTNPELVAQAFVNALDKFDVTGVLDGTVELDGKTFNRPSCLKNARTDSLAGLLTAHAQDLWRSLVVANAPGRSSLYVFDWVKNKIMTLFGVTDKNKFKDITPEWREKVAQKFDTVFKSYIRGYVAFENRLVGLYRNEIAKALNDGGDSRFANVADVAKRNQLIEDVLGGYLDQIEGVLGRYAATPDAFNNLSNRDLARLVRDSLGLEKRGDVTDVAKTSGYAGIVDRLDKAIVNRQDLIKGYIANGYGKDDKFSQKIGLKQDVASRILERIGASPDRVESWLRGDQTIVTKALVERVATYVTDYAKGHPVDAFEPEYEAFAEKLATKAFAVLDKVMDSNAKARKALSGRLQTTFNEVMNSNAPEWMQNRVGDEQMAVLGRFAESLFDLAVSATAKGSQGFDQAVDSLVGKFADGFSAYVENLKAMKTEVSDDIRKATQETFDARFKDGREQLVAHGAAPNVLVQYIRDVQGVWAQLPNLVAEMGRKVLQTSGKDSRAVANLKKDVSDKMLELQGELTKTYLGLLDDRGAEFTGCGIMNELAKHGIDAETYPDREIFEGIVASYLKDPGAVDMYEDIQFNAILKARQSGNARIGLGMDEHRIGNMTTEQFEKVVEGFWSGTAANFRLQYAIKAAQKRVRGEIEAQKAQMADVARENAWKQETVDKVVARSVAALEAKLAALDKIDVRLTSDANVNHVETDYALDNLKVDFAGDLRREIEAEGWLKDNLDAIVDRVMQLESKSFIFDPGHWSDKAVQDLAAANRERVRDLVREGLANGVLLSGGAKDWNETFKEILADGKMLPSPDMLDRIHGNLRAEIRHLGAVMDSRVAVSNAMNKEANMATDLCDQALLTWCMPSSIHSPRNGSKIPGSYYYEKLTDAASAAFSGAKSLYASPTGVYNMLKEAQKSNDAIDRLFGPEGYGAVIDKMQREIKAKLERNIRQQEDGRFTYTSTYTLDDMREDADTFLKRLTGLDDPMKKKNKDVTKVFEKFVDGLGK